jgi:hypothetical protein
MAGTERNGGQARRRFVTRAQVEDAAASGQPIRVQGRDVLTDEAEQRAADLGVRIERDTGAARSAGPRQAAQPSAQPASDAELRRAVRNAVIAELGSEPSGLDAAIGRVLDRRGR